MQVTTTDSSQRETSLDAGWHFENVLSGLTVQMIMTEEVRLETCRADKPVRSVQKRVDAFEDDYDHLPVKHDQVYRGFFTVKPRVPGQADAVAHAVVLAPGQQLLAGIRGIRPHQDLDPGPPLAKPGDDAAQRLGHASSGVRVARAQQGEERMAAAADVERQEAVVVVVAVVGPALLAPVHLVVRGVDVQHEPRWRLAPPRVDERLQQHLLKLPGVMLDLVVAPRLATPRGVLEPVGGAHPPALAPLTCEATGLTLCGHRSSVGNRVKFMAYINLTSPGGRCSLMAVRNAG